MKLRKIFTKRYWRYFPWKWRIFWAAHKCKNCINCCFYHKPNNPILLDYLFCSQHRKQVNANDTCNLFNFFDTSNRKILYKVK